MIPLIQKFVHELLYSPEAARVWLRGFLGWASMTLAQVVAAGPDVVAHWTLKDWALRIVVSGIAGFALLVKAGEKNAAPQPPGSSP